MADVAQARACPNCGTLVTVSGSYSDALLKGTCPNPGCAHAMTITHEAMVQHPLYGNVYRKVSDAAIEAAPAPVAEAVTLIDGYQVLVSQPVGGQWVAVVPQINVEPVGGPTREAALAAAAEKIEAAKPKPVVTEAEKTAAWEV